MNVRSLSPLALTAILGNSIIAAQAAPDRSAKLLELAEDRFGDLTPADRKLFVQAANGLVADYASESEEDRILGADRMRWLCTNPEAKSEVLPHEGIKLKGVHIPDLLELDNVQLEFPLAIEDSEMPEGILLKRAHLFDLSLSGTETGPIDAQGLVVDHAINMSGDFKAVGRVLLLSARIGDDMLCDGGQFHNPTGTALSANGIEVEGSVFLSRLDAKGEVSLIGANIGGALLCMGSVLDNPSGDALSAGGIQVGEDIGLGGGFQAKGGVSLRGASTRSNLVCTGGVFSNPQGKALDADGIEVKGFVFLSGGFQANGEVSLIEANIGGSLVCTDSMFNNPSGSALTAHSIKVEGNVIMGGGFQAEGSVSLYGADIGGSLLGVGGAFNNPSGTALYADSIRVGGNVVLSGQFHAEGVVDFTAAEVGRLFKWLQVVEPAKCKLLDLESASIGTLWDEKESWPQELRLDGLVYKRLHQASPLSADVRVDDWIRSTKDEGFQPQPYEQLARVLQEMGHEGEARKVLIAKEEDPARLAAMSPLGRIGHRAFGWTIGYGYRPWMAGLWILGFLGLGTVFFGLSYHGAGFVELSKDSSPKFNAVVYSLDGFVPLIDLYQVKYRLPTGRVMRTYFWFHVLAGWVLSTLLVIGLTGLVQG